MKEIILINDPIDYALCQALGESPADFVVLHVDGKQMNGFGSPFFSRKTLEDYKEIARLLNSKTGKTWAKFYASWKSKFMEQFNLAPTTTAEDFRPVFSVEIHRVCAGYSKHMSAAMILFETGKNNLLAWSLAKTSLDEYCCELISTMGRKISEEGESAPRVIATAFHKLLCQP